MKPRFRSLGWHLSLLGAFLASARPAHATEWDIDAFARVRYRQSWVSVSPRLSSLIVEQLPDAKVAAAAVRAVKDTARYNDGFELTRADAALHVQPDPWLQGQARIDASRLLRSEQAEQAVRELCGTWTPRPWLAVTAGVFALPFSLHELMEQRNFELTDEGPTHRLLEHLGYYGRDTGVMLTLRPRRELALDVAATAAGALGAQDYRGPGLLSARLSASPLPFLELTSAVSARPHALDAWWEELRYRYQAMDRGIAISNQAALLFDRWTLRAEWLAGQRTDNDVLIPVAFRRGDARAFAALWAMGTARIPFAGFTLVPSGRVEWMDADRDHPDVGELIQMSFGLALDLNPRVRISSEVQRRVVQPGTLDFDFEVLRYMTDVTSASLQLQLGL